MPERLFVYGTLRHGYDHPMARLLAGEGSYLGKATTPGRLVIACDDGHSFYPGFLDGPGEVTGDVFEISETLLARMDAYEGCSPEDPEPHPYRRVRRALTMSTSAGEAWVYLYVANSSGMPEVPGGDFLEFQR